MVHRVDGELGCWTAVEWRPAHLRGAVERLWHFRGRTAHPRERVLPSGLLQLIVQLDERYGAVRGADAGMALTPGTGASVTGGTGVERYPALVLSGQQLHASVIEAPARVSTVLGIDLTPEGACRLLRRPLHDLTGLDVDVRDLIGREADALADRCDAASRDARACLAAAGAWLEKRLRAAPALDPAIAWIAHRIRLRRGDVSIAALRDAAGLSAGQLAAGFRSQVGVTAKAYARLRRFHHAATRLRAGASPAEAALDAGYYDQPHLTVEFRQLSGLTPAAFAASLGYQMGLNVPED